jgi:hypothetical protein
MLLIAVILLSIITVLTSTMIVVAFTQIKNLRQSLDRLQETQSLHSREISGLIQHGQNVAVGLNDVILSLQNRDRFILSKTMLNPTVMGEA